MKDETLRILELVQRHEEKQGLSNCSYSLPERVEYALQEYNDKSIQAISGAMEFRDEILVTFRALALVLEMSANAATHREKNARLRGAIELIESAVDKLRKVQFDNLYSRFEYHRVLKCDFPTREFRDRIFELERQLKELQIENEQLKTQKSEPLCES